MPLPASIRGEKPVLLQRARQLGRDRGAFKLGQIHLALALAEARLATPAALARRSGRQLLPDHAQRHELVALEAQDRLQQLDVLLAERR